MCLLFSRHTLIIKEGRHDERELSDHGAKGVAMKTIKFTSVLVLGIILFVNINCVIAKESPPKLILQITVDGLRGDLPGRYFDRYGKGGFRYFFEKGIVYTNAHFLHSNLETVVGHSVLATGAFPSANGMVANVWMNRAVYVWAKSFSTPREMDQSRRTAINSKKGDIIPFIAHRA